MEIKEVSNWTELRTIIGDLASKMTAGEIVKWNELSADADLGAAKSFVEALVLTIEVMQTIENNLDTMKKQLAMFDGSLVRCNFIVGWEVSGLSIAIEHKENEERLNTRDAYVTGTPTPTMWEYDTAQVIARNIANGSGSHPMVYDKRIWYTKQIDRLERTLKEWTNNRNQIRK